MEYTSITQSLLNILGVLGLIFITAFLMYGMLKGFYMEKEARLRNRRRYSWDSTDLTILKKPLLIDTNQ